MFEMLAVLGVGAIGSIIGAYRTPAGTDVTLIDPWGEHVETMKRDGLRITAQDEEFTVPVNAIHLGRLNTVAEPFDESTVLRMAYACQQHAKLFERRPPSSWN